MEKHSAGEIASSDAIQHQEIVENLSHNVSGE